MDNGPKGIRQSRLDNIRGKPRDEKTAIAGGVAITVVSILILGWAILFLHNLTRPTSPVQYNSGAYDTSALQQAQNDYLPNAQQTNLGTPFGTSSNVPSANRNY